MRLGVLSTVAALVAMPILAGGALAEDGKYGPGASDNEIKVGRTIAYSGPASAHGLGKAEDAYFKSLNAKGGINGRKINFISLDDSYSPPKAVENARRLVESDQVALLFNALGTPLNVAIRPYMNQKKVPQLFIAAGATTFNDPQHSSARTC
jgi:branched-chain amino acid transport system substrate-binding protein